MFGHSSYSSYTLDKIKIKAQEQSLKDLEKALQESDIRVEMDVMHIHNGDRLILLGVNLPRTRIKLFNACHVIFKAALNRLESSKREAITRSVVLVWKYISRSI